MARGGIARVGRGKRTGRPDGGVRDPLWAGFGGMAFALGSADGAVDLFGVWVAPEWRGRGLARALVGTVIAWAHTTHRSRIELWVADGNDAAIALYTGLGFAPTGLRQPLSSDPSRHEQAMRLEFARDHTL